MRRLLLLLLIILPTVDVAGTSPLDFLLQGSGDDRILRILPHSSGYLIAGTTTSPDLDFQGSYSGGIDVFLGYVANGNLEWGLYVGGSGQEKIADLIISGTTIYLAGSTTSQDVFFDGYRPVQDDILVG